MQKKRQAQLRTPTGWTRKRDGGCGSYSYRSDSTGVISAARWAGYMPAVTVINESVRIEAIIEIQETIGCGTKSGRGNVSIAAHNPIPNVKPKMPLTMVNMADSA